MEGQWKFQGGGGGEWQKQKFLKKVWSGAKFEFPEGWVEVQTKKTFHGRYEYFLEPYIMHYVNHVQTIFFKTVF